MNQLLVGNQCKCDGKNASIDLLDCYLWVIMNNIRINYVINFSNRINRIE